MNGNELFVNVKFENVLNVCMHKNGQRGCTKLDASENSPSTSTSIAVCRMIVMVLKMKSTVKNSKITGKVIHSFSTLNMLMFFNKKYG